MILKAEVRGSIEAIRKELEKLVHDEVRVRVLHAGIGGITESDVQLALTSPEDTIIVGFNVVPDDAALRLAEERGIQIREYNIIYKLTDDIKAALEGKLKPRRGGHPPGPGGGPRRRSRSARSAPSPAATSPRGHRAVGQGPGHPRRRGHLPAGREDRVGLESLKRFKDDVRRSARASSAA